jgi:hypothetical protein
VDEDKVVRASQLIASVGPTFRRCWSLAII